GRVNEGLLCVKGKFAFDFINHPDRLTQPLIRGEDGELHPTSWDNALNVVSNKIKEIKEKFCSDAIAGFSGAKATNEENYLFMKLMRAVVGTNNVDHCARLCHSSSVAGLAATLGSGAMTNPIADVRNADVIFITGSNTTKTHPVMGAFIRQAKLNGTKLIVADPVRIPLAEIADIYLQIKPGTSLVLHNCMLNIILSEGLEDADYIKQYSTGFDELKESVNEYTLGFTAEICGVPAEDIISAAKMYAKAKNASIIYAMGITQHINGTNNVISLSNLAVCTGNLGHSGSGVNPLRGQNNVQGACDMGSLPQFYTAYQQTADQTSREKFEKAWNVSLPTTTGLTKTLAIPSVLNDKVKMLFIMGENPAVSDPDSTQTIKALKKAFLVVSDIFLTETAELADVVLPAACFAEKDGTFTNSERRVQLVNKAVSPKGEALADWLIIMMLSNRLGYNCHYDTPEDIFNEMAKLTPSYAGMTYRRLVEHGLCWPCPTEDHPGTPILHVGGPAKGKAELKVTKWESSPEVENHEYPIMLTTNRLLYQFHTRTMTAKSKSVNTKSPNNFIQINPENAIELGISDGETVNVSSPRGSITVPAVITNEVAKGVAAMPFHWADGANVLTAAVPLDSVSKIAGLKLTGIKIEKLM
ncbi:MAG: formate dehydrogenase subunit alpha, partial [Oscillospiraceae bacterium]|nr:formate dehydrogenase subunit alpha [Oscillospiraceae bacterium]